MQIARNDKKKKQRRKLSEQNKKERVSCIDFGSVACYGLYWTTGLFFQTLIVGYTYTLRGYRLKWVTMKFHCFTKFTGFYH